MRSWLLLLALVFTGCLHLGADNLELGSDPCPGHGTTGGLFEVSSCSCPLKTEITPQLQGQACTAPATRCYAETSFASFSCLCSSATNRWDCSPPDLGTPDLGAPSDLGPAPETD